MLANPGGHEKVIVYTKICCELSLLKKEEDLTNKLLILN